MYLFGKVMSLLFNMLSRLVIAFLQRKQASFNFMAAVTICSVFGAQRNKVFYCFHCFPIYWERSVFIPIPKKGNAKECSNYRTSALISHTSKIMPQILQARLQQYVKRELPDVQAGFRKGRGPRDQIANFHWIIEKAREFQKIIHFCFIDYTKAVDCVDHNKLWKILKEMGIPDHLTCLLRSLYTGQEATVRTGRGKTDWFQIGKGVH